VAVLIDIRNLRKRYGEAHALDGVTLSVEEGQFVAVIGASGSGKTTLLKSINRLAIPSAGQIVIEGVADRLSPADLRRSIGYVFQGIGLFPHMTVAENIGVVPTLLGWPASDIRARTAELLDLVALPQAYGDRQPAALSGGEQQRVGVARALAARPRIMLMDEPFGALDPVTRDSLGQAYRALHQRLGLTTVMVTHDVQEAILLADRIVVMQAGRVAADGSPAQLLAGHPDPAVSALMDMPRRQSKRVHDLISGRSPHG